MPDLSFELMHGRGDGKIVCGVDEVGRGPLAGPVVAAAAILPFEGLDPDLAAQINDSKKLTAKKREALFPLLTAQCVYAVAEATVQEIDTLNILHASLLAMTRAVRSLSTQPHHALIDGNKLPKDLPCSSSFIVKGDSKSLSIAVASIIAKVTRDRLMVQLHESFPHYGWDRNAGYGTALHMAGLHKNGPTVWHRRSFAPVAEICKEKGLSDKLAEQA